MDGAVDVVEVVSAGACDVVVVAGRTTVVVPSVPLREVHAEANSVSASVTRYRLRDRRTMP